MTARAELAIALALTLIVATPFAAGLIEWHAQNSEQTQ